MQAGTLYRWRKLSPERKRLVIEAAFYLPVIRAVVTVLPGRMLRPLLNRRARRLRVTAADGEWLRSEVAWAVESAATRMPGRYVCFPRAIAAAEMLKRRGIEATICYGAAVDPAHGLQAHAWVQVGDIGVIGHREAGRFKLLNSYPQTQQRRAL